jgi:enediyne biosynthesis protein E4
MKYIIRVVIILFTAFFLFKCESRDEKNVPADMPLFIKVPSDQSGIFFKNEIEEKFDNYFVFFPYIYNGGGVAVGDINNDGLIDIYFTSNEQNNKLYLNKGDFKFEDITKSAGVAGKKGWDNGVVMADVNADGYLDIYISRGGWQDTDEERKNLLYINNGDLTFTEKAAEYGLDDMAYSIHASFFDMDNDNDLDVYIINRPDSFYLPLSTMAANRHIPNDYFRDKLYRNDGGVFKEIGKEAGITENFGYSLGVITADFNLDGYKDIFVSNDYSERDFLFINNGDGTFTDRMEAATNHLSLASMGADMADINNDGLEDLIVLEMQPEDYRRAKTSMPPMDQEGYDAILQAGMYKQYLHNVLHLNMGNLFFSEIGYYAGITNTDWSWGCLASDYDNDGYRDLFIANGFRRDVMHGDIQLKIREFINMNRHRFNSAMDMFNNGFDEFINLYEGIKLKNYLFKNNGDLTFTDVSGEWGFTELSYSNGAAIADFDNDGDLDIVVNNLGAEAFLFENTQKNNNYIQVELAGPELNPSGLGAYISIYYDGGFQFYENKTVRGYLSSSTPIPHFGLGKIDIIDSLKVRWTDGHENKVANIAVNQRIKIPYTESEPARGPILKKLSQKQSIKESTRSSLTPVFLHRENDFNDYKDQKLLPHQFSRSGPFISVGDFNGDGLDDFYIGGAKGQAGSLYQQRNQKFIKVASSSILADKDYEDMGSVFFDVDGDGDLDLYVVSGGSEYAEGHEMYQDRLYLNDGTGKFTKTSVPKTISSGSCVISADFDQDGDMDLFVGGQVMGGLYPHPPRSYILVNEGGKLVDKTEEIAPDISRIGMVNSGVFADINNNGRPELIIVGEWMPIKVFEYSENKFRDISLSASLDYTNGWWNKVIAADLDNDGDLDLIVGNLGENYKFKASLKYPFHVFANDYDRNGTNDIFLAYYHGDRLKPVRGKEILTQQFPYMNILFPTFNDFARADMSDILGAIPPSSIHLQAYQFSSIILINEGGKFTTRKLPLHAQFSTLNGIVVKDINEDGMKDLMIGGNKFDVEVETTPADASPGFVLLGLGNFEYKVQMPYESGFFIPYNVKDLQLINSGDKWSVLVSSNNDSLRVFEPEK